MCSLDMEDPSWRSEAQLKHIRSFKVAASKMVEREDHLVRPYSFESQAWPFCTAVQSEACLAVNEFTASSHWQPSAPYFWQHGLHIARV